MLSGTDMEHILVSISLLLSWALMVITSESSLQSLNS